MQHLWLLLLIAFIAAFVPLMVRPSSWPVSEPRATEKFGKSCDFEEMDDLLKVDNTRLAMCKGSTPIFSLRTYIMQYSESKEVNVRDFIQLKE